MENGENGWQLSLRIGTAQPPSIRLHRVTLKISDCVFDCVYLHLILSRLAFSLIKKHILRKENQTKKILNLNHRLNKMKYKFANMQTTFEFFYQHLY